MYCRNCGKEVNEKAIACPACGVPPLCEDKYCSKCGASTQKDSILCTQCGERVGIHPQSALPALWRKIIIMLIVYVVLWITTAIFGGRSISKLSTQVSIKNNVNQTDSYYKIRSPCPFIVSAMRGSLNINKADTAAWFLWVGHPVELKSPLSKQSTNLIKFGIFGLIIAIRKIWVIS
jgi:uncharacterized membrane protein YvbJ